MACIANITTVRMATATMVNHVSAFQTRPFAYRPITWRSLAMSTMKTRRTGSRTPFMTCATIMIPKRLTSGSTTTTAEMAMTAVMIPR